MTDIIEENRTKMCTWPDDCTTIVASDCNSCSKSSIVEQEVHSAVRSTTEIKLRHAGVYPMRMILFGGAVLSLLSLSSARPVLARADIDSRFVEIKQKLAEVYRPFAAHETAVRVEDTSGTDRYEPNRRTVRCERFTDGKQTDLHFSAWEKLSGTEWDPAKAGETPTSRWRTTWDGASYGLVVLPADGEPTNLTVGTLIDMTRHFAMNSPSAPLDGYPPGEIDTVVQLLDQCQSHAVQEDHASGRKLIKIEASGPYGALRVWVDPSADDRVIRVENHVTGDDLLGGKVLSKLHRPTSSKNADPTNLSDYPTVTTYDGAMHDFVYADIGGHFVATEVSCDIQQVYSDGCITRSTTQSKRTFDPSFTPDVKHDYAIDGLEGTDVNSREWKDGISRIWSGGRVIAAVDARNVAKVDRDVSQLSVAVAEPDGEQSTGRSTRLVWTGAIAAALLCIVIAVIHKLKRPRSSAE